MTMNKTAVPDKDADNGAHFSFRRMGGINQVVMATDYDWQHLSELDPKLWMALSCPIRGLEFNLPTLEALDTDKDGRIRAQEVKEAVEWVCACVSHPAKLAECRAEVAAADLRADTTEGVKLQSALQMALKKFDRNDALSLAEIETVLAEASGYAFNGDGVVTEDSAEYAASGDQAFAALAEDVRLAMACVGAKRDASGTPGIDEALFDEFEKRLEAVKHWRGMIQKARAPLGEKTGDGWTLIQKLGPKLDDYFYRCQVAAYSPNTLDALNEDKFAESLVGAHEGEGRAQVDNAVLATLPLARVDAAGVLDLARNINPAWKDDVAAFSSVFAPFLETDNGDARLGAETWHGIKQKFGDYGEALKQKPQYPLPPEDAARVGLPTGQELAQAPADDPLKRDFLPLDPNGTLDGLDDAKIAYLLDAKTGAKMRELFKLDLDAPALASFQDLRKLALFNGYLYTFLMNFLSFMDFYDPEKKAIFQSGVLYLDSRACSLCVPVDNIDAHARLADSSHLCLIYCDCSRKETDGAEKTGAIAAALTQGHLASLLDGRHGLFVDNAGKEWDTRIARIVHNPVSLEEAVWSPYIRIANMISEQIQKFVSTKDEAITKMAGDSIAKAAAASKSGEAKPGFDFAKGAGIFAAVSVALSVLSAAFAYIASSVASLGWWWPLALVVVFLCISGPSVFLAWLKLRRRSLGPLLDASGWAVNQGAPINLAMGASLTSIAKLPPNSKCDPDDPYSLPGQLLRKKWRNRFWLAIVLALVFAVAGFMLYCNLAGEPLWLFRLRAMAGI